MRMPPILSDKYPPTGRNKLPAMTHTVVKSAARTAANPFWALKNIVR